MKQFLLIILAALACPLANAQQHNGRNMAQKKVMADEPQGEKHVYWRSGNCVKLTGTGGNYVLEDDRQDGLTMTVVYDADGKTVYMKDPIAYYAQFTWVKGERNGNTITVPTGQDIDEGEYGGVTYSIRTAVMVADDEYFYVADPSITEVTYTIDGDNISLDGCDKDHIYSAYYTDNDEWILRGDYGTRLTTFDGIATTPPAGMQTKTYAYTGKNSMENDVDFDVLIGQDGDNVYIQGFFDQYPDGWVVGKRNGNTITFSCGQYAGTVDNEQVFIAGGTEDRQLTDFVLTYDDATDTYTQQTPYLMANNSSLAWWYFEYYTGGTYKSSEAKAMTPTEPAIFAYSPKTDDKQAYIYLSIYPEDADGQPLRKSYLKYQLYAGWGTQTKPLLFDAKDYYFEYFGMDTGDLYQIPATYDDGGYFIFFEKKYGLYYVALLQEDIDTWERIGAQTVYTAGGEERTSDIVWRTINTNGIADNMAGSATAEYYDMQGRRLDKPQKGLNIAKTKLADGTLATRKIMTK